ncbi:hypothetical protein CEXT_509521 [Caerostris extrusa]|uniref:Uncharacterized protein n=1 Tax=Caerostris extrusa TaxID=172846 RepID=A0AAV4YDJ6_CAEEX|nr:hypothetical protein CEXT_509521 [Caerostris extrusa]
MNRHLMPKISRYFVKELSMFESSDRQAACIPDCPMTVPVSITMSTFAALHLADSLLNPLFMLFFVL